MPAYDYLCRVCGHRFDVRQKMSDSEVTNCPRCSGGVSRLISGGAGTITQVGTSGSFAESCGERPCAIGGGCCNPAMACGGRFGKN